MLSWLAGMGGGFEVPNTWRLTIAAEPVSSLPRGTPPLWCRAQYKKAREALSRQVRGATAEALASGLDVVSAAKAGMQAGATAVKAANRERRRRGHPG